MKRGLRRLARLAHLPPRCRIQSITIIAPSDNVTPVIVILMADDVEHFVFCLCRVAWSTNFLHNRRHESWCIGWIGNIWTA
jgi:hypothetical protein